MRFFVVLIAGEREIALWNDDNAGEFFLCGHERGVRLEPGEIIREITKGELMGERLISCN